MIPAVAYLRMSTDAQEASIPAQREAVKAYAKTHGYRLIREYVDSGISGDDTAKRVEFQRMLRDAAKGEFKSVLCWNQDRFGRFDLLEAGFWITPLRAAGVSLVTVQQGKIDWNDFAGRLVYSIEQEGKNKFLRDLSWNVNRGKLAKAKAGDWMGGAAPFGYELVGKAKLGIKDDEAEIVRLIFRLFTQGKSLTAVARELNHRGLPGPGCDHWNRTAITRIVDNILYTGANRFNRTCAAKYSAVIGGTIVSINGDGKERVTDESNWQIVPNAHPGIVTQAEFDAAQQSRKNHQSWATGRPSNQPIIFRGILRCGRCGKTMQGEFVRAFNDICYVCTAYSSKRQCDPNRTYQAPLLALVREHIQDELLDPVKWEQARQLAIRAAAAPVASPVASLRKKRDSIQAKLTKAESRLLEVPSDMVAIVAQQVRELRDQLSLAVADLSAASVPRDDPTRDIDQRFEQFRMALQSTLQHGGKSHVMREAIDHIEVVSEKVKSTSPKGRYEIAEVTIYPKFPEIPQ